MTKKGAKEPTYGTSAIRQLKGLEAVRERPGMYLGDPSSGDALHHCIWEVVDNAVDEHLAGHCSEIIITLLPDGGVVVVDNGRGIPVGPHPEEGIDTLQLVMTSLHAGGKFDADSYDKSAGLHGIGVSAVNAVSRKCVATVHRDGAAWEQSYEEGKPVTPVLRFADSALTCTQIAWWWDPKVFHGDTEYDRKRIAARVEELAFLNPGLMLRLRDERDPEKTWKKDFHFANGIRGFLDELVGKKKGALPAMYFADGPTGQWNVEIAMTWTESSDEDIRCYANNTANRDGGTHLTGFKNGLTRLVTSYAKEHGLLKGLSAEGITGSDIREGIVAVVNARLRNIAFSSQTKDKLVTPQAKTYVEELFKDQVEAYFTANPGIAKKIAERAVLSARAREAAKKARDEVKRKDFMDPLSLPGKLADCRSKRPAECELFIVEGDSAGGSAKGARDREYQAILPLRGKVLNTERANIESILENKEIGTIVTALGCGLEATRTFDPKKLRYHKVIIMTDADVDGAHIRTLLLTFFYRCMPRLIFDGRVYVAKPPLYGVRFGGARSEYYFTDEERLAEFRQGLSADQTRRMRVVRYKGLGEMNPEELWATTLDPTARVLLPVSVEDAVLAEQIFYELMGDDVDIRKGWIESNAEFAELDV